MTIFNAQSLYEFLKSSEYAADIEKYVGAKASQIKDYSRFVDILKDALEEVANEYVTRELLQDIDFDTYREIYPDINIGLSSGTVGQSNAQENDSAKEFWTDFSTNATDPFKGVQSYVDRFNKNYKQLTESKVRPVSDLVSDSNSRLNSVPSYQSEYLRQGLTAATEHGARRLIASMPSITESLDKQIKDYASPSGFMQRPTGLDIYSMLNSDENRQQGFRGFVFQLQSTTAVAGVLNRTGPTTVGTQGYVSNLKNDSTPDKGTSILAGNDLSVRAAELYGENKNRIKPVYQDEGSIHAKIGYFYGTEIDGTIDENSPSSYKLINKVFIGTQNWTPTLDRSTTVEEMLLLNRKDARSQSAFDILAHQSRAAVDSLLELTGNQSQSALTRDTFKAKYESKLGVFKDDPAKILFVNEEIHNQIAGKLQAAEISKSDKAVLSIQYIENVLNPTRAGDKEHSPFGIKVNDNGTISVSRGFGALESLAKEGRLSIAITTTSHGQDQGLFKLLDAYKAIGQKAEGERTEVEQRKYALVETLLKTNSFTMMPSQFMHSKSFAILGQDNELKAYGIGSANLSNFAYEKNIETMAIFDGTIHRKGNESFRTLDALNKQTEDDIQQAYLYGYSRFHLNGRSKYQGLLIEQRGKENIAKMGYDYLKAMGGAEASSWDDPASKGKKFIYSKRYLVGEGDAKTVGATIQIASPIAGQAGYSFAVTFGGEAVMHGQGPEGLQPVVYLNKTQRLIAGMVYKNTSGKSRVYNIFDLKGGQGSLNQKALEHGDSYQANAFDVLGGLIETTYHAMKYEHQVRGLYAAYGMAEKDTFEGSIRRYVGTSINQILGESGVNLASRRGTNDLYAVASDFVLSTTGRSTRERNILFTNLQQQLTKRLGSGIEDYDVFRPLMAKTAAMDDQRVTFMTDQVNKLLTGLQTLQKTGGATDSAIKAQVDSFTKAITAEVNKSLNFGNFAPGQNNFTGLYNDLVMQAIDLDPTLKGIYKAEIELGKRESFSNMIDIFSQPHETGFSFGQGFHRLPVYGEDQYINNTYSILRDDKPGGFIMSPFALMHGESLGSSGQYLRAVASSGRLKFQDAYTRYGGLLKLEGGAPVVHELESLMKSMPGLDIVRKREYTLEVLKSLKNAGYKSKESYKVAKQLAEETFSRYKEQRTGDDYNEDDETLYFFPFAKSEQISQRMKNLTSTRPIFNASAEFVKYAMSFGAVEKYDVSDSKNSLGGNVLATLTAQQYKALTQEYLRRYKEKNTVSDGTSDQELLNNADTDLLRKIAKEWTVNQKQLTKGFLGGYAPRRIVIVDGASQLSDSGLINTKLKDNGQTISYVQPHVVQATATLDSFIASPGKLNQVIQKQLRPGTIFLARDLKIQDQDIITQLNNKLNLNIQRALTDNGITVTQLPDNGKGNFNLTDYIETISRISGLDAPTAKRLVLDTLKSVKKEFKNIKMEYGRNQETIEFYYERGVYSPADSSRLNNSEKGKVDYIESLSKVGEIVGSEVGQGLSVTINDLFQYSTVTGDGRAKPITFRIPAVSALELGPAISVLSEATLAMNGSNTVILDLDMQTLKDFKEGMRGGLDTAKGPMRSAEEAFWKTIKTFTKGTEALLPQRVASQEVFAMLSSSQIKGFNFGMGLGLLEQKEQSGIYQLINEGDNNTAGGGRAVAEALAMLLLTRSDLEDISGLRGALATSLEGFNYEDGTSRGQYAEALKIRNRANPDEKGKLLDGVAKDLSSSLDYFGQLAGLVSPALMEGRTLQQALTEQVRLALSGDEDALSRLQSGTVSLFNDVFKNSFKSGEGVYTLLDGFSSRPAGLMAFLLKASQDVYRDVDVDKRLKEAGFAEVVLSKESIFTQDYSSDSSADLYLRKLSEAVKPGTTYTGKLRSMMVKHETTELVRSINELNGGDISKYRSNLENLNKDNVKDYINKLKKASTATGLDKQRLQKEADIIGAKLGTVGFNVDSVDSMLKLGYHPIVAAYKESTGLSNDDYLKHINTKEGINGLKAFINVNNVDRITSKLKQNRLPEFIATEEKIEELEKRGLSLDTIYKLIESYGKDGESRLLQTVKGSNLATYTALEMYGRFGELGKKLGSGIEEIASRFGYSLPDSKVISAILQKLQTVGKITTEEELKLKEVEAVYGAIRTYLQTQRMIELPGEYTPGKLTVPTGMKNITALEGHFAQGLTKKQLESYTYNAKNEHDVGSVQQALVSLAMIYESSVPSQRQVQAKYSLQMQNLTDNAIIQYVMQTEEQNIISDTYQKNPTADLMTYLSRSINDSEKQETGKAFSKSLNQAKAEEFSATFLTNYTGFSKHQLPGNINSFGDLETRSIGEQAIHKFIKTGSQYVEGNTFIPGLSDMVNYAHYTRHNLGDNLSYDDNIDRRTDLIIKDTESRLARKLNSGNTLGIIGAVTALAEQERIRLHEDFDMREFLNTIYRSNTNIKVGNETINLGRLSFEEKSLQRSILNTNEDNRLTEAGVEPLSSEAVRKLGIKNYAESLRSDIRQKVINTFRTDTGAEYLEGMELLYNTAKQQEEYHKNLISNSTLTTEQRMLAEDRMGQAQALQQSLKSSRFVSLPNLLVIDQHGVNEQGEFKGKNTVTIGAERSAQTGVILGLDILQKMSLLFNQESHPALEAQFRLVAKLQKTQSLLNQIQYNSLKNQNTDISDEELKDLQELPLLMYQTKQTAIDLIHNKNSIRQATANRLGMSGTSYIAVNSFLVGVDEVGLGSRIDRASGAENGDSMSRLASSMEKDVRKQTELFKIVSASGHKGFIQYEMTINNEKDNLTKFLTNINPNDSQAKQAAILLKSLNEIGNVTDTESIQNILLRVKSFINKYGDSINEQLTKLNGDEQGTLKSTLQIKLSEERKALTQRIKNIDNTISYLKGDKLIESYTPYLKFGISSGSIKYHQSKLQKAQSAQNFFTIKLEKTQKDLAWQTKTIEMLQGSDKTDGLITKKELFFKAQQKELNKMVKRYQASNDWFEKENSKSKIAIGELQKDIEKIDTVVKPQLLKDLAEVTPKLNMAFNSFNALPDDQKVFSRYIHNLGFEVNKERQLQEVAGGKANYTTDDYKKFVFNVEDSSIAASYLKDIRSNPNTLLDITKFELKQLTETFKTLQSKISGVHYKKLEKNKQYLSLEQVFTENTLIAKLMRAEYFKQLDPVKTQPKDALYLVEHRLQQQLNRLPVEKEVLKLKIEYEQEKIKEKQKSLNDQITRVQRKSRFLYGTLTNDIPITDGVQNEQTNYELAKLKIINIFNEIESIENKLNSIKANDSSTESQEKLAELQKEVSRLTSELESTTVENKDLLNVKDPTVKTTTEVLNDSFINQLNSLKKDVRSLKRTAVFESIKPLDQQVQELKARLSGAVRKQSDLEKQLNTAWVNSKGEAQTEGLISLQAKADKLQSVREKELAAKQDAYTQVSEQHRAYQDLMLGRQEYYETQIKQLTEINKTGNLSEVDETIKEYTKKLNSIKEITEGKTNDVSTIAQLLNSFENELDGDEALSRLNLVKQYVSTSVRKYNAPKYFELDVDFGLNQEQAKQKADFVSKLINYQKLKQTDGYTVNEAYETEIQNRLSTAGIVGNLVDPTGTIIASKEQLTEQLLNQEQDIYSNYPDITKYTEQLSGWANLLRNFAYKYQNQNASLITPQDLFARLMRNESLDYIVVASITGQEWDKSELEKGMSEVERIIGIGAVMTGRQGAPFGSSAPPSGHSLNAMAKQGVYITEINRRAKELNSYFVSNEDAASTLMLVSAFGFEFTGLGDYDGDSFQAALTKINAMTGTISEATITIKRLERQLNDIEEALKINTDAYVVSELKEQKAALEDKKRLAEADKIKAEQLIEHNKNEIARHQAGKTQHAYDGLRSYIGSYVALPQQVVGSRNISELTVFRDDALRGTVKQFRDTLGGFNWDTDLGRGEIGSYVYATALEFEDNKLKNVTFSKQIEDLGDRRSSKIVKDFKFWATQFEQSGRYNDFVQAQGGNLTADNKDRYIEEVSAYQAEMESTVMSMFTLKKIFGNVTGTQIDPSNLGSMQAIMGTTGGSLLGKVYNTVVPISAGLAANTSFNRMLLDPDLVGAFNKSVETGFDKVIDGNTQVDQALIAVKGMLTQTAIDSNTTTIIPWKVAQRQTEDSSAVMYRFLLTAQQYLRDSALKPKQAGGLVGRIREYTVSDSAITQLKAAGINDEEAIKAMVGYDDIISKEREFANNDQKAKYIQIISQDFLGNVANKALEYNYGPAVRGQSVQETEGLTAFAALRLLTDYVGGAGNSATNLMESSTYSDTLKSIKLRYETELEQDTLNETLHRRLVTNNRIDDNKLVNYVLTDMLNKFQAQFIIDANLENTDFIKIQETEAALKLYGLNDKGQLKDTADADIHFAATEDYIKDVQSYLNINSGEDDANRLFSAEAYDILNGIDDPDSTREQRIAEVEADATRRLNSKYTNPDTQQDIQSRLKARRDEVETDMKAQQRAIQAAIEEETARNKGETLSDSQLTKAVFTGLIEHEVGSQTEKLMPALDNLRAFNQAVNEIASNGSTSKLSKALLDQQSTYGALAMEFQAQQYALDSGKLVGESLPKAFSQTVLNIVDAIQNNEGIRDTEGRLTLSEPEMKGVMAALSLGGALPQNTLPMIEEATKGLDEAGKLDFQRKFINALTVQGGALEQVANANAYQTAQLGMSSLQNTLTDMLQAENEKLSSMAADSPEAEIQINKIEQMQAANQIAQQQVNQNYQDYVVAQEDIKQNIGGGEFVSPKNNVERIVNTVFEQSARSNELIRATAQNAELHQQLRKTHTLAEGVSILAVPLLFSAMQGDILTSKEQLTSLGADVIQSAVMSNSYEESSLRNFISPTTDAASLKRMASIGNKFQYGRMQQFLMNYESPTEGLARAAVSELIYSGAAMTGSLLGQAIDARRDGLAGLPGVSGQTGIGRVVTELAGGVIGMAVGGMVSQRPLPETNVTQDEFMADVVKSMVQSYQNIQNYLSQNLLGNEDEDLEVMDSDGNEPIAMGLSQGDIRQSVVGTNAMALTVQEYLQVISEDADSPTTAQLLGLA